MNKELPTACSDTTVLQYMTRYEKMTVIAKKVIVSGVVKTGFQPAFCAIFFAN